MRPTTILVSLIISLALLASACAPSLEPATRTPSPPARAETSTPTLEPIQVLEFDGFTVSLISYHWESDRLITEFSFFNDRLKKNESIDMYAYDQDGNRIWGERGTWPMGVSVPILWPGETKENTITWRCGPRSTTITITFRFGEWPTYTKKSLTITR